MERNTVRTLAMLTDLGLEHLLSCFEQHRIDDEILTELDDAELVEIGVTALGDRKRIRRYLDQVQAPILPAPTKQPDEQRRLVTVLFADLVQSTRISQTIDPEDMRRLIRGYHAIARDAADRFGGRIVQFLGDGIYAYFGHPRAHEDDPERAVRMGFQLISALADMNQAWEHKIGFRLEIRVGIEVGRVVVGGAEKAVDGQSILLTGEAPNVAAHLQAKAKPGTLVVGPHAVELLSAVADFVPPEQDCAPDGARVVESLRDRVDETLAAKDLSKGPFIGRRRELNVLNDALRSIRSGQTLCVAIVGEPGIGKSRLVGEFISGLSSGTRVLSGACAALDASAYHLIRDLLMSLPGVERGMSTAEMHKAILQEIDHDGEELAAVTPYLLHLAGLSDANGQIQPDLLAVRAREGIAELLRRSGETLPTVVFLNDLHWIDERSERVLSYILGRADCSGVLFICTYRNRYKARWQNLPTVHELKLRPLNADDSAALYNGLGGGYVRPDDNLIAKSGGNPYFIQALARIGEPDDVEQAKSQSVPLSLEGLLQERIDRLSPAALEIIRTASAIGQCFDPEDLMKPGPDRKAALTELLDNGYLVDDAKRPELCRFSHALMQTAVYEGMVRDDLVRIHTRIADRIENASDRESDARSEELARHFEVAGDTVKAARNAFASGMKAEALFALEDAGHWFETVLRLLSETHSEQEARMRREAVARLIYVRCWNAQFDEMVALADAALADLEAEDLSAETARFLSWMAEAYIHTFRLDEARTILKRVLATEVSTLPASERIMALAQSCWLASLEPEQSGTGFLARSMTELAGLVHTIEAGPYPQFMLEYSRTASAMHVGDYKRAASQADALIGFGEARGYPPASCWGSCFQAYIAAAGGKETEAETHFGIAAHNALSRFDQLAVDLCRGAALHQLGRDEKALEILYRLRRHVPEVGAFYFGHLALAAQGTAMALSGDPDGVAMLRRETEKYEAQGYTAGAAVLLGRLGDALRHTGQSLPAVDALNRALRLSEDLGMTRLQSEVRTSLEACEAEIGEGPTT